jgi:hypothetical protein
MLFTEGRERDFGCSTLNPNDCIQDVRYPGSHSPAYTGPRVSYVYGSHAFYL